LWWELAHGVDTPLVPLWCHLGAFPSDETFSDIVNASPYFSGVRLSMDDMVLN